MQTDWIQRFLDLAELVSGWSKDPSSKVGAVISKGNVIVSLGFNGFPVGTEDSPENLNDRDIKHLRVVHAEANAILFAKQDLVGCTITTTRIPCPTCTGLIIQSGIKEIYSRKPTQEYVAKYRVRMEESAKMLREAGVSLQLL